MVDIGLDKSNNENIMEGIVNYLISSKKFQTKFTNDFALSMSDKFVLTSALKD